MTAPSVFTATPEQRAAIEHALSPLLVVAGAGTGKTSVMAERILHLVESGAVRTDQVLGLTFTNKAAANLKQRVIERLGPDSDVNVTTYHAFGAGLVADHAIELDLHPETEVLNRAQAWQLLFDVFDEFRFEKRSTFRPGLVVDDALQLASRCADHLVAIDEVVADCEEVMRDGAWPKQRDAAAKRLELCQVVAAYERRKRERRLIDYGDQVALAVRLLREHPDLAAALHEQHPVVLLDEYQDTNYAQRILLQLIYPEGSAVTAVGDDMQSIYGFRGAHLGNILQFTRHFAPAEQKPLETNRRSGPELVTLANRIQANVEHALDKTLTAMEGAESTLLECFVASDDADEAAVIADEIAGLGPPWSDNAVLCRKRRLIPAIVSALEARSVPVDVVGAGGLLERPEIVDLVSWLEVLTDLSATVPLLRILEGPRYRIGLRDLAALARHARRDEGLQLADALDDLDAVADLSMSARTRLAGFCRERRELSAAAARLSVLDLAEAITRRTGLWDAAGNRGRENLLRFFDLASRFAPVHGDPGLPAFVEYVRLLDETDEELAEAHLSDTDSVRVMTVHQAKGLEFPNVWVPGLAGGSGRGWSIFPDSRLGENPLTTAAVLPWWVRPDDEGLPDWRSVEKPAELEAPIRQRREEEEWRLFYVACTRAQHRLTCSAAQWYPGPAEPQGPSRFYEFIAAQTDLVKERFRRDAPAVDPAAAARERRRDAVAARATAKPVAVDAPPQLFDVESLPPPPSSSLRPAPSVLSVTGLVSYARCPLQFYWSAVRPLPRLPSAAAQLGTEVHRWIEQRAGRQLALLDDDFLAPDGAVDRAVQESPAAALRRSFLDSPYASIEPAKVEAPFQLVVNGRLVRGRIDAVYERDGFTELVDFKTGSRPEEGDGGASMQLDVYALAAVETWGVDPSRVRTTYCWLRVDGPAELDSKQWDVGAVAAVRNRLGADLDAIGDRRFAETPGPWCARCDFLAFCPAGQKAVG